MVYKGEMVVDRNDLEKTEKKKGELIEKLISRGVYKIDRIHLFELNLTELEKLYQKVCMGHECWNIAKD
ncbi:Fur-regulated basic protein FbpA [Niallia sp. XMNu-256]|uniref:Fur-regulated basic protein FbpA n=1 Tax=Niallia sp. XMNu-256 TaxID=3082444 RepID=UPI0030CD588F